MSPRQDEFRSAGRRLKDLSAAAAKARAEQAAAEAEAEAPTAPQPPSDAPPAVRRRRSKKTGAWILKEEAAAPPRAAESQGVVLDLADHVREAELIEKVRAKVQAVPADAVGAPILSAQKRASWLKTASTLSSTAPPRIRLVASRAQTAPAQAGARPQQLGSSPQLLQRDERAL